MEFPGVGLRCAIESCKQNDFLPIKCNHCAESFCKDHFNILSHNCTRIHDNIVIQPENTSEYYNCSTVSCSNRSPVEMICIECKKHYCLAHRHHGCLESNNAEIETKLIQWEKPKETFAVAKNAVDNLITDNLKKSKKVNLANKVQLMRLKGRAVGSKGIPIADRRYFLIHLPLSAYKKEPQAIFVCNQWTVGRTVDSIAEILGIRNLNNVANSEKLKMFHHSHGDVIANGMDIILSELFNDNSLVDGDNLILEYSNADKIDSSLYK